jgi:hypothetical protein
MEAHIYCDVFKNLIPVFQTPQIYLAGNGTDRAFDAMLYPLQKYISRSGTYKVP